jgi:hypothetical protein
MFPQAKPKHHSRFVADCNSKLDFVHRVLWAESNALKRGLLLADTLGVLKGQFEFW